MKGEMVGILDGKTIMRMEIDNEAENPVTLHLGPGFKDAAQKLEHWQIETLMEIVKDAYSAISKALRPSSPHVTFIKAPKLLAVGEVASEPGNYRVVDPMAKKADDAHKLFEKVMMSGNADTYAELLGALQGINLPEPAKAQEEPTGTNEPASE